MIDVTEWDAIFGDIALLGWRFEEVGQLTLSQLLAVLKEAKAKMKLDLAMHGFQTSSKSDGTSSIDQTAMLENRVASLKKITGRASLDFWEVMGYGK